jgi:hypothetical protein
MKYMVLSAIAVTLTRSDVMEALQISGIVSLGCVAFIGMIYGEILLLNKS